MLADTFYFQYKAKAIGLGSEGAQAILQDTSLGPLALEILKHSVNVEVAAVTSRVRTCSLLLLLPPFLSPLIDDPATN